MKSNLLIIGANGHGKVVADIALKMSKWKKVAFLDDSESIKMSMGLEVVGNLLDVNKFIEDFDIIVGIGNNRIREKLQDDLEEKGASVPTLIHPSAIIGEQVELSHGTVVMAGAVINCCSKIGKGCIINTSVTIDHDSVIEDYAHISPGANLAGSVKIGQRSWIGIGSVVSNNVVISSMSVIGAGAVVIKDISEVGTYIGVPAKKL